MKFHSKYWYRMHTLFIAHFGYIHREYSLWLYNRKRDKLQTEDSKNELSLFRTVCNISVYFKDVSLIFFMIIVIIICCRF